VPISFTEAALGCSLEVPTLQGKLSMNVPKGTQAETIFRFKNKGISNLRNNKVKGDQMIVIKIEIPRKLTDKQEQLLREFSATLNEDSLPEGKSFFHKVKKIFG